MNKLYTLVGLMILFMSTSCKSSQLTSSKTVDDNELNNLIKLMSGEFSSKEQSQRDTLFYDINLVMFQIWENDNEAKWLYVEQAVTANIRKPYRQRVYRVSKVENGLIESRVYELPNPSNYIHAWNQPSVFNQINPDSLIVREGCAVFLERNNDNCFSGSTKNKACKSTFRNAEYATSKVSVCSDQISSWDQGWDGGDTQVWGAETMGYVFKRIK